MGSSFHSEPECVIRSARDGIGSSMNSELNVAFGWNNNEVGTLNKKNVYLHKSVFFRVWVSLREAGLSNP